MTAPRIPLFQRKGAPPAMSSAPPGPAIPDAPMGGPPEASEGEPTTVQCQGCGATIDTQTGAVVDAGGTTADAGPDAGGADISAKLATMMGGPS